ncbi:MAG TPA: CehA/McbA family metallohydrolase, partial [Labilithrix sp.]
MSLLGSPRSFGAVAAVLGLSLARDGGSFVASMPLAAATPAPAAAVAAIDIGTPRTTCLVGDGTLVLAPEGGTRRELEISIVVDGTERAVTDSPPVRIGDHEVELRGPDETRVVLVFDPARDVLVAELEDAPAGATVRLGTSATDLFVPGHGPVEEAGDLQASLALLDDPARPIAILEPRGDVLVSVLSAELDGEGQVGVPRAVFTASQIAIAIGATSQAVWTTAAAIGGEPLARVSGRVTGVGERARVIGLDAEGNVLLRFFADDDGRFAVDAPLDAVRWYATLDSAQASAPVAHTPGDPGEVALEVKPGGRLVIRVVDPDGDVPLLSRIIVRGADGTPDPIVRGEYKGVAAGPVIDLRDGEATLPVPAGRYRIEATKGIEWSLDMTVVDVANGHTVPVQLAPRHVVPSRGLVGCDLHVHARPSFDSQVRAEDRVLSLASAGVSFAVPTEHNRVGDYGPAIQARALEGELAWVRGVEVTTVKPSFGHFGVFPLPKGAPPPPDKGTNVGAIFAAARKASPKTVIVVHHPRMRGGLGYFTTIGFDSRAGRVPANMRTDFDVLEVYSGVEILDRAKVESSMADWLALLDLGKRYAASGSSDSHKLQFQWAGYPRTYVRAGSLDESAIVASIKAGRGFVTSGPILTVDADGAAPGDELHMTSDRVSMLLRVEAAPWIDATSIEVVANGAPIWRAPIPSRELVTGPE